MSRKSQVLGISIAALVCICSSQSQAQQREQRVRARVVGMTQAEKKATELVVNRLRLKYDSARYDITARPILIQNRGNSARPITGNRPLVIEAQVTMKNLPRTKIRRFLHRFRPDAHARWYVQNPADKTRTVVEGANMGLIARLGRVLPLREKLHDILKSNGARSGAGLAAAGFASGLFGGPVGDVAGLGFVLLAGREISKGLERRNEARKSAVAETAKWAKESMGQQQGAVTPTPDEAFEFYKSALETTKPGTHPGGMESFLDRLAGHHL
ncbi:MAG: hypothetical protein V1754_00815 [Pseudomonadota bacterium]